MATFDTRAILSAACLNAVAVSASRAALAGQDGSLWVAHDLSVPLRKTRVGEKRGGACELAATKIGHVSTGLALTCVEMRENRAVTCGLDSFARVWDVEKCSATSTVPCGGKAVLCMSGTDEGLVVGAVDGGLRAIDLRDGGGVSAACGSVKGHVGGIGDVCVWGDVYVSGGFDGSLRFWDRRWMGVPVRVVENVCGGKVLAVAGRRGRGRVWAGGEGGVLGAVCVEGE